MNPYDAVFLALGLTILAERTPRRAWLAAAPLLAWVGAGWLPDGLREPVLGVLLACCLPRRVGCQSPDGGFGRGDFRTGQGARRSRCPVRIGDDQQRSPVRKAAGPTRWMEFDSPLTPAAFLLAAPRYADGLEALRAGVIWLLALGLLQGVEDRAATAPLSPRWRGAPLRLMVCAVLHATLLPLRYLI